MEETGEAKPETMGKASKKAKNLTIFFEKFNPALGKADTLIV
jgi:hypothetical protein